jgi:hypothetical protein
MVGFPFDIPQSNDQDKVNYSVGNPMGAYSSWASFAVAHHYVMFYCCQKLGIDWKTAQYKLLGDDIVIKGLELGNLYIDVITSLGVEVSKVKTHKSKNFFEFAKRYFYHSKEITHFPISALKESGKRYYLLTNTLIDVESKG